MGTTIPDVRVINVRLALGMKLRAYCALSSSVRTTAIVTGLAGEEGTRATPGV